MGFFDFLTGGGSDATTSTTQNNVLIQKSNVDIMTSNIVTDITNTIYSAAATCGANANASQIATLTNLSASGDISLNIGQEQKVQLNFSCLQTNTLRSAAANNIADQMTTAVNNAASSQIQSQLDAVAAAKEKSGFASWGQPGASTATNTTINYTQNTTSNVHLISAIQQSISNNFSSSDVQQCISQMTGNQNIFIDDVSAGKNITFVGTQTQALTSLSNCQQFQDSANNIVTTILNGLDIGVVNTSETKTETKSESKASSETNNSGLFESLGTGLASAARGIGDGINSILGGIGGIIDSATLGWLASAFLIFCCCFIFLGFMMLMMGSGVSGVSGMADDNTNYSNNDSSSTEAELYGDNVDAADILPINQSSRVPENGYIGDIKTATQNLPEHINNLSKICRDHPNMCGKAKKFADNVKHHTANGFVKLLNTREQFFLP